MNSGEGRGPDQAELNKLSGDARIEGERDLIDWESMESSLKRFGGYHLTILGSDHRNYSDLVLFKRVPAFRGPRPRDPYLVFEIINAYTLAFFDRHIRNRPAPLLEQDGSWGVRYEAYQTRGVTR